MKLIDIPTVARIASERAPHNIAITTGEAPRAFGMANVPYLRIADDTGERDLWLYVEEPDTVWIQLNERNREWVAEIRPVDIDSNEISDALFSVLDGRFHFGRHAWPWRHRMIVDGHPWLILERRG